MLLRISFAAVFLSTMASQSWAQTDATAPADSPPQTHPAAITYSDAYQTRLKIHKYASYATLPLFATELALGRSLYNNSQTGGATKTWHGVVGGGIVGLFGVNTVTGVWNMWEGRHDPDKKTLRLTHGILMLVADGGFVATTAMTPHNRARFAGLPDSNRALHRDLAIGSVGVATVGYLMMLFGGR
jgi:hypothetical protein